ncbi:hypothetical protein ACLB2K_032076 [Fragaria x ananassa]
MFNFCNSRRPLNCHYGLATKPWSFLLYALSDPTTTSLASARVTSLLAAHPRAIPFIILARLATAKARELNFKQGSNKIGSVCVQQDWKHICGVAELEKCNSNEISNKCSSSEILNNHTTCTQMNFLVGVATSS